MDALPGYTSPWPVDLEPEVQIACTNWPASVVLNIEEDFSDVTKRDDVTRKEGEEVPTARFSRGTELTEISTNI